jgi:hypothetical protein
MESRRDPTNLSDDEWLCIRPQGIKRSTVVDAEGIPLGTVAASANRHD